MVLSLLTAASFFSLLVEATIVVAEAVAVAVDAAVVVVAVTVATRPILARVSPQAK